MKKSILKITILFFLLMSLTLSAQDFQGKAYYQTKRKVDLKIGGSEMSEAQQKQMQEMMKKQFEKTYILTFNKEASVYKQEEQLEKPTGASGNGIQIIAFGSGSTGLELYKNTKKKTFSDEKNVFGKPFLVKDNLEIYEWKLEDESKIIGKYLCFKATVTREVEAMEMIIGNDEDKNSDKESKATKEIQIITAWYTTDIPISNGPDKFWGLPGLILELNDGDNMQYVCTKIIMNTKDGISEPTKGKIVNQEGYRKIMEKKMKEMQEQYHGRGRKGGQRIHIEIGG